MCGRFVVSYTYQELLSFLGNTFNIFDLDPSIQVPRYNIAPGQNVVAVIQSKNEYRAGQLRWGFVPSFSKDESIGYKMINARSETIASKPSFKSSFTHKRCVILADGFYEWKRTDQSKTPMLITLNDKKMFMFAGLWSSFKKADGTILYTTTIITTKANEMMSDLHDRMPVILDVEDAKKWLNTELHDAKKLQSLLSQYDSSKMTYYEVSPIVNNAKNDVEECIMPL